jgi:Zn-dependent M32 family carboxypeptidase
LCVLQAYDELAAKLRELDALNGISGLLGWDELVGTSSSSSSLWQSPSKNSSSSGTCTNS